MDGRRNRRFVGFKLTHYRELDAIAWYQDNSGGKTHPVRLKQANAFGLYDMLGSVMEWTETNYNAVTRVVRGGSWVGSATIARASYRIGEVPAAQYYGIGFRCVEEVRWRLGFCVSATWYSPGGRLP